MNNAIDLYMDRESHYDTGAIISSIALLQERFKELQRAKAMRAEREALREFSNQFTTKSMDPNMPYEERASFCFHPQLPEVDPTRGHGFGSSLSHVSLSLSLWPTMPIMYGQDGYTHRGTETQLLINFWPTVTGNPSSNSTSLNNHEDMDTDCDSVDLDTSLHL